MNQVMKHRRRSALARDRAAIRRSGIGARAWGYALVALCCLLLTACGFQLRGGGKVPPAMSRTHLVLPDENGDLARALRPLLETNGVELVGADTEDAATLAVSTDNMQRDILTVGRQARVNEFRLHYVVRFSANDAEGKPLLAERTLELNRDYTFNEANVLGKSNEEDTLRKELYQEMARLMLLHLSEAEHGGA